VADGERFGGGDDEVRLDDPAAFARSSNSGAGPLTDPWRRRVARARVARLATVTATDRPHAVPCCFVLVRDDRGDVVYSAVDAKPKSTLALKRLANVAARPWASLLVDRYREDWSALWWVRLDGPARVVVDPTEAEAARAALRAKYPQYRSVGLPGAVLAVDVTDWRSWPTGARARPD
jgi:PPOX class probable F420-dependent enzyme